MHDALTLLNEFDQDHIKKIFIIGRSKMFAPTTPIIDVDVHDKHGILVVKEVL